MTLGRKFGFGKYIWPGIGVYEGNFYDDRFHSIIIVIQMKE